MKKYVVLLAILTITASYDGAEQQKGVVGLGYYSCRLTIPEDHELFSPLFFIPEQYREIIETESGATGVPSWIVAGLARVESQYDPNAVHVNDNGTIDSGLMQLNSRSIPEFEWRYNNGDIIDPFDPATSVRTACRHLARLYSATGDWVDTVMAYNAGLSRVQSGRIPSSTRGYAFKIFGKEYLDMRRARLNAEKSHRIHQDL